MFKKAKRANFRRRNESDEDEQQQQDEGLQPPLAPTSFGPVVEEIPFMETSSHSVSGAAGSTDNHQSNGFQANVNSLKAVKKEKKAKDTAVVPGPTKASLLSFDDEEGNVNLINQHWAR